MTYDKMEREYKDFSPSAKRGCDKYGMLSSNEMVRIREQYHAKTGKNPGHILNKQGFYNFVDKTVKLRIRHFR